MSGERRPFTLVAGATGKWISSVSGFVVSGIADVASPVSEDGSMDIILVMGPVKSVMSEESVKRTVREVDVLPGVMLIVVPVSFFSRVVSVKFSVVVLVVREDGSRGPFGNTVCFVVLWSPLS